MYDRLNEAVKALLAEALPSLFGGDDPPVKIGTTDNRFKLDARSAEADASAPRPDDRADDLAFDPAKPEGPYQLATIPDPGPRRVYLTTELKDRIALRDDEVVWDDTDTRAFALQLRPARDLTGVDGVRVLYTVAGVYVRLKVSHTFSLLLESTSAQKVQQAESLAVAVISLNRRRLIEQAAYEFQEGDYGVAATVKSLKLVEGTASPKKRVLDFNAEIELKATRAMSEDEGRPILRIRTEGLPSDPNRPVDIRIDVEA
ncbi:MAG TPA: hypothetical protein VN282_11855 [Pyrinomonadaceae bacterium]|nr:hypothetical protein [Pyrinomonadaceae bacterium]